MEGHTIIDRWADRQIEGHKNIDRWADRQMEGYKITDRQADRRMRHGIKSMVPFFQCLKLQLGHMLRLKTEKVRLKKMFKSFFFNSSFFHFFFIQIFSTDLKRKKFMALKFSIIFRTCAISLP
jgi:hypothetical protein